MQLRLLATIFLVNILISDNTIAEAKVYLGDVSGTWIGKITPQDEECGDEPRDFTLVVTNGAYTVETYGPNQEHKFSGSIKNGKIADKIKWDMILPQGSADATIAEWSGTFTSENKFIGQVSATGFEMEDTKDVQFVCASNIDLTPKKIVLQNKKATNQKDLTSIKKLLKEGLITKKQFTRMRDKIEGKDKASQLLKSDKELEEKLETIKQLFMKQLITQEEYDVMRKKVLGLN
ncbi:SHOCT domain-containing protein [Alphaproteobacteria bacterium]|nr:SHOCT domain-containing protein [Alphaproteobacteria bacterium]